MILKDLFAKPVDRSIDGVIKADDAAKLRLELEEYVITNEVEKRLEEFLHAYNNSTDANGAWISGFFGSGKSHLLKMLALVLENRKLEDTSALNLFLPKCKDNVLLTSELRKATSFPSKSILFNIDQKADLITQKGTDALLSVFVKVFDEMCGYYGKAGYVAQFERDLDGRGLLQVFKDAFQESAGHSWESGREQVVFESPNIASAYAKVTGTKAADAEGILDKYERNYKLSIEDFASQVNDYIQKQAPNFRLNFFVDEVGQFIANNVRLMTNLQTVAESLATKCQGRAWILVTAQEDMSNVVGEMNRQQANDFSKIQARFKNRLKLSSADVAEVIKRRLLEKKEEAKAPIAAIYQEQVNNFKTLFDFTDGAQTYRNYRHEADFVDSYPFVSYQFPLFQAAIQNLSLHNAFEGKHSSVGERSMLAVFQDVAKQIADHRLGELATFDLMYEGIRLTIKSQIQHAIRTAEQHLDHPFAIRLLKALFLVKYVKEFKPTVRNLCVLMLGDFKQDLQKLREQVEEALNLLESQTYIQRQGEYYSYLTNEEKDVEEAIKSTDVETSEVAKLLESLIFDECFKSFRSNKIRYPHNGQDYVYARKMDHRLLGKDHDLAIHVISAYYDDTQDITQLQMQNMGKSELMIVLPKEDRFYQDLRLYLQTEKYVRQNMTVSQQDTTARIIRDRGQANQERHRDLIDKVHRLIAEARMFIGNHETSPSSENGATRVQKAFCELIPQTFTQLQMLGTNSYREQDLGGLLRQSQDSLFANDAVALSEAEQEVFNSIQSQHRQHQRPSVKSVIERFEGKPYGWYYAAILAQIALLCARGKTEVRLDSNVVELPQLEALLKNTQKHASLMLEPQIALEASQIRRLREFHDDLFGEYLGANEPKALGDAFVKSFAKLQEEVHALAIEISPFAFKQALSPANEKLEFFTQKPGTWFLTEILKHQEDLDDLKELVIEPIRKFVKSPNKGALEQAKTLFQRHASNLSYLDSPETQAVKALLDDPKAYQGKALFGLKERLETLEAQIQQKLAEHCSDAKSEVQAMLARLEGSEEFSQCTPEQQEELRQAFEAFPQSLSRETDIARLKDRLATFKSQEHQKWMNQIHAWITPPVVTAANAPAAPAIQRDFDEFTPAPAVVAPPRPSSVHLRDLKVDFRKLTLSSEADVDAYLDALRLSMINALQQGHTLQTF